MAQSVFTLLVVTTCACGAAAIYLLLSGRQWAARWSVLALGGVSAALVWLCFAAQADWWYETHPESPASSALFLVVAGVSLVAAAMTITSPQATMSVVWFLLLLLSNAGLYTIHGAQFLAAATVLGMSGGLGVMLLIVAKWAETRCSRSEPIIAHEPLLVCVSGALLAAGMISTFHSRLAAASVAKPVRLVESIHRRQALIDNRHEQQSHHLRIRADAPHVEQAGAALFNVYPLAVVIASGLMLVAMVTALIIAQGATGPGPSIDDPQSAESQTVLPTRSRLNCGNKTD
jgi:NADH:ubiquinone oxidoreductase subunit 6 (subunit J)